MLPGISEMMQLHGSAVLFDLDGVLVDSSAYIERQWREWAASRGLHAEAFLRYCHGRRAVETIRLAAPELDAEAEVARFRDVAVPDEERPARFPGAQELLTALPPDGWAVVTSGSRAVARRRLVDAGLPVPAVLVSAEDVRQGKPSPEGYLCAAGLLGRAPNESIVIEDAPAGVEAARAAGMRVIAVTTTHPALELHAATVLAPSLTAIHLGAADPRSGSRFTLELAAECATPRAPYVPPRLASR
jgi:sugar-phosphatase